MFCVLASHDGSDAVSGTSLTLPSQVSESQYLRVDDMKTT